MAIREEGRRDLQAIMAGWMERHGTPEDLGELEELAEEVSRVVGRSVVECGLESSGERRGYRGSSVACECGRKARFVSYRPRGVGTLFGTVSIERAYYHCKHCKTAQVPWDREQGLSRLIWTPRVKALVSQVAARLPYGESVDLLAQLTGFEIEESGAERVVAEVGGRLRAEEGELMSGYDCGEITPLVAQASDRLYVGMDGTSAHIDGSWCEVKTGVVYDREVGSDGMDVCGDQRYVAAQEYAERFGERLYVTAAQGGVEWAEEVVVIGDGAEWIWNLAAHHYPGAVEILDYWHACEHIYELARVYYGEGNAKGKRWAQDHCRWLKERGPGTLLRSLNRMKPKTVEQEKAIEREWGYFTRNRKRMQYARYRQKGMMIGSGPVEAGCKTVVGARLKGSGMRWSSDGADAVLAIRTALLSRHYDRVQRMAKVA